MAGLTPPPPPPSFGGGLLSSDVVSSGLTFPFLRPEVKGLYYNAQLIKLDGYKFVGCRFDNCNLYVDSTNFDLINCVIDKTTKVTYGTNLIKAIQLFNNPHEWAEKHFGAYFVPKKNPDGTITITRNTL